MKAPFFLFIVIFCFALSCEKNGFDNSNDPIPVCQGALEEKPISFRYDPDNQGDITFFYNNGQPYVKLEGKFDSLEVGDYLFEYVDGDVDTIYEDTPRSHLILNDSKVAGEKTFNLSKDDIDSLAANHVVRMAGIELYSTIYGQINDLMACFSQRMQ